MSKYTFTFKKNDILVEFTTTDKAAVERQFPIWVAEADAAAKKIKTEEKKSSEPRREVKEPQRAQKPAYVEPEVQKPQAAPSAAKKAPEPPVERVQESAVEAQASPSEGVQEGGQVFDQASNLLKTINTIQNPPQEVQTEEKPAAAVDFDKVLSATLEHPTFEPNQRTDEDFLNLVKSKNTSDRFHYLMITAYYLSEHEKMDRFTLKQINAKLMNNLSRVVDHTILRDAISQDFIALVPDLTGTAEAAEYRITEKGEDFFFNGF